MLLVIVGRRRGTTKRCLGRRRQREQNKGNSGRRKFHNGYIYISIYVSDGMYVCTVFGTIWISKRTISTHEEAEAAASRRDEGVGVGTRKEMKRNETKRKEKKR